MNKTLDIKNVFEDIQSVIFDTPNVVKKIGIFGSLARGDYDNNSDIDIIIEYDAPSEFDLELFTQYCDLCNRLSDTLTDIYGRGVDIVHFENDPKLSLSDSDAIRDIQWL